MIYLLAIPPAAWLIEVDEEGTHATAEVVFDLLRAIGYTAETLARDGIDLEPARLGEDYVDMEARARWLDALLLDPPDDAVFEVLRPLSTVEVRGEAELVRHRNEEASPGLTSLMDRCTELADAGQRPGRDIVDHAELWTASAQVSPDTLRALWVKLAHACGITDPEVTAEWQSARQAVLKAVGQQ